MGIPAAKIRQFLDANSVLNDTEPEVIIECPACQTKFRIEASKLTAASVQVNAVQSSSAKAKFHCSRCDYIFAAEVATDEQPENQFSDMNDKQQLSFNFDQSQTSDDSLENIKANENKIEDVVIANEIEHLPNEHYKQSEVEETTYIDPESPEIQGFIKEDQFFGAENDSDPLSAATEIAEPLIATQEEISEVEKTASYQEPSFPWSKPQESSFTSRITENEQQPDYSKYAQDFSARDQEEERLEIIKQKGSFAQEVFQIPEQNAEYSINSAVSNPSALRTFTIFLLPILILLGALAASTLYLKNNIRSGEKLLSSVFPSVMREAPGGVFIQQPKIETLVLDSGDVVNVVSGSLINKSQKTLSAIVVEAIGFSDSGKIVANEKVLIGNPISTNSTTLRTLSPSEIRKLQAKEPKNFILRPENKLKFILVFTDPLNLNNKDEEKRMSSFAVRIHSARYQKH